MNNDLTSLWEKTLNIIKEKWVLASILGLSCNPILYLPIP